MDKFSAPTWLAPRSVWNSNSTRWTCFIALSIISLALIWNISSPALSPPDDGASADYDKTVLTYIPPLGLGTWQLPKDKAPGIVQRALENGYRHIDAALVYGNEKEVGQGISAAKLPRSSFWVTSKLWNDAHKPAAVRPALETTLHDLGLEYLDLYLMHWPVSFKPGTGSKIVLDNVPILETWWEMESLVRDGLVRQIGVSNFNQAQVEQLLRHARIRPTVHEFETHPFLQQQEFVDWNLEQGLRVIAYSPLGNMNPIYQSSATPLLDDPFLSEMANKKGITVAQLVLAWNMHRGVIVIPKSDHGERVLENFQAQSIVLTEEEVQAISSNDRKTRFSNPTDMWGTGTTLYAGLDGVDW
ncbi:dihydrodiol dehydrogenase [Penicillium chermesinum]|uniref:D-xylose reductase [NAD(P)H] n=1 Tax=Penicillium chermesinum TaxID=63820 RepID=A0A9W9NHH8_9EURO|nr:dihydrodiol dehydrogenase [Penicillium chermesinum]KAJ5219926.1 dihydrodiol dehydrogenase [Penicillium chermesinum]KAJ6157385.1 dihydrodiol dehydrogenase [Penicillium chermesinum]